MQTTQTTTETPELLTVPEAAERLRVSRPTAYRLVRAGTIPALRIGRDGSGPIRIPATALDAFLYGPPPRESDGCGGSAASSHPSPGEER